jgi:hypothetical protein
LQRTSIDALHSLLQGQGKILFRDERIEDYGVDGAFELKLAGFMTNFRAQVQLKGVVSAETNKDGSISLSVRTANLNYLLNGTSPIYLLFDAKREEFLYVWAREEEKRLGAVNSDWKNQQEVTLRFTRRLTTDTLAAIVDHILREGRMLRHIHDALARSTTSEHVTFRIDSCSLETTDPSQALTILMASGPAIVASGYPEQALQLLALIDPRTGSAPRLQLTAGYAEYMLGKHYSAIGHIRQAMARAQELSKRDQSFLSRLKDASEFRVGIIDADAYQQRADERARALTGLESLEAQLEVLQRRYLGERNPEVRANLAKETREITRRILNHPEATPPIKLSASLTLLYIEGTEANMGVTNQLVLSRMRASVFPGRTKQTLEGCRQAISRLAVWHASSIDALNQAFDLGHPILIGQAHIVVLGVFLAGLMSQRIEALYYDREFKVDDEARSRVLQGIKSALAIYDINGAVEDRLRVNALKMDFLEITGDLAGAKELAQRIYPEADAMGLANLAQQAKELLEERSLLMRVERDVLKLKETDEDVSIAAQSDEEIQRFARETLLSLGLPAGRMKIVEQCCLYMREVARERCHWCRYLQMLEEQPRTPDPATAHSTLPNQKCVCEKFGHATKIVTSDAHALIGAFKQLYCAGCKDRDPKQARCRC